MANLKAPLSELAKIGARLKRWRKQHDTPAKVAAAHRRVVLSRVVESMEFENEAVSMGRLRVLLKPAKSGQRR